MDTAFELQANVLKTLSSPRRLEILHRLAAGPCEVGRLAGELGMSQPNVSQHLALMRAAGVVEATREGREVQYRVADPDIVIACDLMRAVLHRRLTRLVDSTGVAQAVAATPRTTGRAAATPHVPAAPLPSRRRRPWTNP
jgi:ArsR family transcriptional regulator